MANLPRPKRYRVTGEDEEGDIHAFETDSRDRAESMRLVFEENHSNVTFDKVRMRP